MLASSGEQYTPPPTEEILAIARARRRERAAEDDAEQPIAPRLSPHALAGLLPPEREMFLRIFAGPSKTTRRKAVRDWQHQIRRVREQTRHGHSQPDPQPDLTDDQQGTWMTPNDRDRAYDSLPGPFAALYRQLGATPISWFDQDALTALIDLDPQVGEQLARTLVDAGLLHEADGGYALSPLGHLHARFKAEQCEIDEHALNNAGLDRLLTFLSDAAGAAERLITPSHRPLWQRESPPESAEPPFDLDEAAALNWLEARLPVYMDAIRFAFADQRFALVCDLAHRMWPLWLRRRHPAQRVEALTLALAAATILQNEDAIGQMLTSLAGAVRGSSPVTGYVYDRHAVLHYQQTGDSLGLAQALNSLGKSALSVGQLEQADQHFAHAEQLRAGLGYVRGAALSRQGRGLVSLARGDAHAAAEQLISAHETLMGCGDAYDGALTLAHHAEALAALGHLDAALAQLDAAATTMRQATSEYGQAVVWEIKARILAAAGQDDQAEQARAHARALYERSEPRAADRMGTSGTAR